jgi:iron complex outermembrane recepter protein
MKKSGKPAGASAGNSERQSLFTLTPIAAACFSLLYASSSAFAQQAPQAPAAAEDAKVKVAQADKPKTEAEIKAEEEKAKEEAKKRAAARAGAPPVETMVVVGIRRGIEDAVSLKRNSDSIIEAVSAEDIGKLPDASIAESLARLPGMTGQRGPDGRVNVISIRGLSPAFSGALLNGREVVSSNDSRAVEYDQFPSELVGSAVVYKTPDAMLIGQGLSGTVDIRALKPLDFRGRTVVVNVRGERNSEDTNVPGVADPTGKRISASYINQFLDNTFGVAVGFARLDVATNVRTTELVEYGDYTPFGLPLTGNAPSRFPYAGGQGQSMLPMFWTATSTTKRNKRDGLMAVFEYKPNANLHSTVDLYFSRFETHEVGGKFLSSMFATWGAGVTPNLTNVVTTQQGQNTYTTSATASDMPVTTGNFDTKRKDDIMAFGWNTSMKLNDDWTGIFDIGYSRDKRNETYAEVYAAPFNPATQQFIYSSFNWNVPIDDGRQTWTPVIPNYLSNPNIIHFGDQQGFNFVSDQDAYTGAIRTPKIKDEIKSMRLTAKRLLDGPFSSLAGGVNYTEREKDVSKNEARLLMQRDANGNFIRTIPTSAIGSPFDMSWAGIPSLIRINVPSLPSSGALSLQPLFEQQVANDSNVNERVTTAYGMLTLDSEVQGIPVRGNVGVQVVHTKQASKGWEYRGNNANPDPSLLFQRSGGATYTDVLPSLNLVAELKNNWIVRFGLAKTMVRPNIVDMRAGTSTPTIVPDLEGPNVGEWTTAFSGNPELEPWRAAGGDLSLEKYFGKRTYVSLAAFRKNLLNYIYNEQSARDNSDFPAIPPPGVTPQRFGPVVKPTNGQGGKIEGYEVAAALEGGMVTDYLDGFGVVVSASKLMSSIKEKDNGNVPLNGLSGRSNSVTAYYEKHGFQARVSQRYRSAFTATTRDIFLNATTLQQRADKVIDLQFGYAWDQGPLKGLSVLLQMNNVKDEPTINNKSLGPNAPEAALLPNYTYYFGRTTLLGFNYKF